METIPAMQRSLRDGDWYRPREALRLESEAERCEVAAERYRRFGDAAGVVIWLPAFLLAVTFFVLCDQLRTLFIVLLALGRIVTWLTQAAIDRAEVTARHLRYEAQRLREQHGALERELAGPTGQRREVGK